MRAGGVVCEWLASAGHVGAANATRRDASHSPVSRDVVVKASPSGCYRSSGGVTRAMFVEAEMTVGARANARAGQRLRLANAYKSYSPRHRLG